MVVFPVLFINLLVVVWSAKAELSCLADDSREINLDVAPEAVNGVVNVTTSLRFTCNVASVGLETLTDPRLCFVSAVNDTTIEMILIHDWDSARQSGTYLFSSIPEVLQGTIVFCVLTDNMDQNLRSQKYRIIVQGAAATPAVTPDVTPTTSAGSLSTVEQVRLSSTVNLTASASVPFNNISDTNDTKDSQEHGNVITPVVSVTAFAAMGTAVVVFIVVLWYRSYWKPNHRKVEISQLKDRTSDTVVNENNEKEDNEEESKFSAGEEVVRNSPTAPVVTPTFSENPIPRTPRERTNQRDLPSQVDGSDVSGSQLLSDETSSASGGDWSVQELRSPPSLGEDVMVEDVTVTHNELVTTQSFVIWKLSRRSEPVAVMQSEVAQDEPTYCFPCL